MAGKGSGNAKNGANEAGGKGGKRYSFSLSLPGMMVAVAVLLFGLAWTFVVGVLVGRGYKPESAVPEIAALMPGAANASKGEVQVLKPEDLQYPDDLARMPAAPPASLTAKAPERPKPADKPAAPAKALEKSADKPPAPAKALEKSPDKPAAKPADNPVDRLADKIEDKLAGKAAARPALQPQAPATAATPLDTEGDSRVYRYVYQVAAFPDPAAAREFKSRLEGIGLKAALEQVTDSAGRTWSRVLVHFQGAPEDTRGLKDKLSGVGVSRVILRDKKPL